MQWYEQDVKALEKRLKENPPKDGVVVFYGSSSFRLWDTLKKDFPNTVLENLAFGGSTLEACGYFFDRIFKNLNPKVIFFYAGDNDIGDGKNPDQIVGYFKNLLKKVRTKYPSTPFVFLSIKPSPSRWNMKEKITSTNERIRLEIEKDQNAHYLDIYTQMLNERLQPETANFSQDMLHMSPKGYELWTNILKNSFKEYLS